MTEPNSTQPIAEGIDEIPTRASAHKALVVSVATGMLVGPGVLIWKSGPPALTAFLERNANAAILLQDNGLTSVLLLWCSVFAIVGAACGVCGILSLIRIRPTYHLLRVALMLVYPAVGGFVVVVWMAISALLHGEIEIDEAAQDRATAIILWWKLCWPSLAIGIYTGWLHALLRKRSVYAAFSGKAGPPMTGDWILENWRTHGRDPRARRSFYSSFITHIMVLIVIPFLLQIGGCVEPYRVPKGSGNQGQRTLSRCGE